MDIELGKRDKPAEATDEPQHDIGKMEVVDDAEMEQFYGSATSDAYRLKSELVSQCMTEIGMGWYLLSPYVKCQSNRSRFQWKLFLVTGFGYVVDNLAR